MSEALPPFSGDNTTCPKCGGEGARTTFLPDGTRCDHLGGFMIMWVLAARQRRLCRRGRHDFPFAAPFDAIRCRGCGATL